MRILIVSNEGPRDHRIGNPIITRLTSSLNNHRLIEYAEFYAFSNHFSDFGKIRKKTKSVDLVHVQFGGLYALLIWLFLTGIHKPKLLTFHGTDIHAKEIKTTRSVLKRVKIYLNQKSSFISIALFDQLGFVTSTLIDYIPHHLRNKYSKKFFIQSLGVDYNVFYPLSLSDACIKLGIPEEKYALFSDKSGTSLKRKDLAVKIIDLLDNKYKLLVMCGVEPDMVPLYINASTFILLTSDEEGSPNIVREALALNKRVFSVDVGDVRIQLDGLNNSAIISRDPSKAADLILNKMNEQYTDNTRATLSNSNSLDKTTDSLVSVYYRILSR